MSYYLKIKPASSSQPGFAPKPDEIDHGELALNTADAVLYTKLADGTIAPVCCGGQTAGPASPAVSPDVDYGHFGGGKYGTIKAWLSVDCTTLEATVTWTYTVGACPRSITGFSVERLVDGHWQREALADIDDRVAVFQLPAPGQVLVRVRTYAGEALDASGTPIDAGQASGTAQGVGSTCDPPALYACVADSPSLGSNTTGCVLSASGTLSLDACIQNSSFLDHTSGQYYRYATYRDNDTCLMPNTTYSTTQSDGHVTFKKMCDGTVVVVEATSWLAVPAHRANLSVPSAPSNGTGSGECVCAQNTSGWFFHNNLLTISDTPCTPFPPDAP